jgi:hypothetical protein
MNALSPGKPSQKLELQFLSFCYSLLQTAGTSIRIDNIRVAKACLESRIMESRFTYLLSATKEIPVRSEEEHGISG